jgi:hypothetical protein
MEMPSSPKSLNFTPDPLSIEARTYYSKCIPEASRSAVSGNVVRIRIPSGRAGTYLSGNKSFLSFSVNNTTQVSNTAAAARATDIRLRQLSKLRL